MQMRLLACAATTVALGWTTSPALAQQTRFAVDATASAGASSNPFLLAEDTEGEGRSAAFVEGVVAPRLTISDELGSSSISGYVRGTAYLGSGYDPTWAIGANAQSQRALNQRTTIRGGVQIDSFIIGERFNTALLGGPVSTPGIGTPDVGTPAVGTLDPTRPAPVIVSPINPIGSPQFLNPDITLLGFGGRQTTIAGNAGLSYQLSTLDSVSVDGQAQRSDNGGQLLSFSSYGGTIGYSRTLSEVTQVGARVSGQWIDYGGGGSGQVYQPQLTIDTRLSPRWRLSAGAGLLFAQNRSIAGRSNSTGISGTGRLCRTGERSDLCLFGARDAGPNGLGAVLRRLSLGGTYARQLSADDNIRANIDYSVVQNDDQLLNVGPFPNNGQSLNGGDFSFVNASAAYDRRLGRRFRAGVAANYRATGGVFSDQSDLSASVFVSTRLGSLQ